MPREGEPAVLEPPSGEQPLRHLALPRTATSKLLMNNITHCILVACAELP